MKKTVCILLLLLTALSIFAQDTLTTKSPENSKSKEKALSFSVGLDYGNTKTYKGHIATATPQNYLSPYFTISSRWGVFATITGNKILSDSVAWDETDLGLGYETKIFEKNKLSISYTHSFFNANSAQINSGLSENIDFYFKRPLFKVLRTKLSFDYSFGDTTDFSITWQNSWPIYFDDVFKTDDNISIIPKIYTYFGSQNYYSLLSKRIKILPKYINSKAADTLRKQGITPKKATPQQIAKATKEAENYFNSKKHIVTNTQARYAITSIYFSLPISYTLGKYFFEFNPSYTMSINKPNYIPPGIDAPPLDYFSFTITIGADF